MHLQRPLIRILTLGILVLTNTIWYAFVPSQAQSRTYPQVVSITPAEPQPADVSFAAFKVTFSQPVTGVDMNDFTIVTRTTSAIVRAADATTDPAIYHVVVERADPGDTLFLAIVDDDSIRNNQALPLGGHGPQNGNALSTRAAPIPQFVHQAHTPRVGGVNVGVDSDIALTNTKTNKNAPVIAYYDATNKTLKLAICSNLTCTNPVIRTITEPGTQNGSTDWGKAPSIVLAKGEIPIISFYDKSNGDLWLTICSNALCTSRSSALIDGVTKDVGAYSAIALTKTGVPVISYANKTNGDQMLAVCNSAKCTSVNIQSVDQVNFGSHNDMLLSSNDLPVLVYYDTINDYLSYTTCNNLVCTSKDSISIAGAVYDKPSLALTKANLPVFSFYDHDANKLMLQRCLNVTCTSLGTLRTIESNCNCVPALTLSNGDIPIIGYSKYDGSTYTLNIAQCDSLDCGSPTITTIYDNVADYGAYPAISMTDNDIPVMSYYDVGNGRLKLHVRSLVIDDGTPLRFNKLPVTVAKQGSMATATIKWSVAPDATSYEYCVQQSVDDCTPTSPSWVSVGTATTAAVAFLPMTTTFYWQVRAVNGAGSTLATGGFATFNTN